MSNEPVDRLEQRAIEERRRLHETAGELKQKVAQTREQFSLHNEVRQHFASVSAAVGIVSFFLGYRIGGTFTAR